MKFVKNLCYALENQTKYVCRDLEPDDFRWRPDDINSAAIGWTAGHILVNQDIIANHRLCGNPVMFDDLLADFGIASNGDFPDSYAIEDIFDKFKQVNGEIVSVLEAKDDSWLEEMFDTSGFPPNWEGKSIGKGFILNFNHGLTHTGQILEVKRMIGKGAWGF
ncbi:MAG: DinB family protein [Candidatus Odinarchaeota archaeon]